MVLLEYRTVTGSGYASAQLFFLRLHLPYRYCNVRVTLTVYLSVRTECGNVCGSQDLQTHFYTV